MVEEDGRDVSEGQVKSLIFISVLSVNTGAEIGLKERFYPN